MEENLCQIFNQVSLALVCLLNERLRCRCPFGLASVRLHSSYLHRHLNDAMVSKQTPRQFSFSILRTYILHLGPNLQPKREPFDYDAILDCSYATVEVAGNRGPIKSSRVTSEYYSTRQVAYLRVWALGNTEDMKPSLMVEVRMWTWMAEPPHGKKEDIDKDHLWWWQRCMEVKLW